MNLATTDFGSPSGKRVLGLHRLATCATVASPMILSARSRAVCRKGYAVLVSLTFCKRLLYGPMKWPSPSFFFLIRLRNLGARIKIRRLPSLHLLSWGLFPSIELHAATPTRAAPRRQIDQYYCVVLHRSSGLLLPSPIASPFFFTIDASASLS